MTKASQMSACLEMRLFRVTGISVPRFRGNRGRGIRVSLPGVAHTAFAYPGLLSPTPAGFSVSACGEKFVFIRAIRVKDPAFFAENLCAFVLGGSSPIKAFQPLAKVFQAVPSRSKAFSRKKRLFIFCGRRGHSCPASFGPFKAF